MVAIMTTLDFSNPFPTNVTCSVWGIKGVSMTKDILRDILAMTFTWYHSKTLWSNFRSLEKFDNVMKSLKNTRVQIESEFHDQVPVGFAEKSNACKIWFDIDVHFKLLLDSQ